MVDRLRFLFVGFLVGSTFTVCMMCGAWYVTQPAAADELTRATPVQLSRQYTFKVLAPKGYPEMGYVAFECQPNLRKSKLLSGKP